MNDNNDFNLNKNMLVAMLASAAIFIIWNMLFVPKQEVKPKKKEEQKTVKKEQIVKKEDIKPKEDRLKKVEVQNKKEELVSLENDRFSIVLSNYGASIKKYTLKGRKYRVDDKNIVLIDEEDNDFLPYSFALKDNSSVILPNNLAYEIKEKNSEKIVFLYQNENIKVTKTYILSDIDYLLKLDLKIENLTGSTQIFSSAMSFSSVYDKNIERDSPFSGAGKSTVYRKYEEDFERLDEDDDEKMTLKNLEFVGVDDQYFASLIKISKRDIYTLKTSVKKSKNVDKFRFILNSEPFKIEPNKTVDFSYKLFNGPKVTDTLKKIDAQDIIDYGFVAVIAKFIHWLIILLHSFIGNFGFALILLTIVVKLVLYPLTKSSYISMHKMKKLKPQLDKLKEKYGDNREKMGRETMALYKKEGVSPLGGCLPMLLQMPIWFGLYRAIQYSVELYNEPFILWITDLSLKDPFYILPITMGVLMFFQQKMSSAGMDQTQAKVMLYTMPIVFTFFMIMLPSGLVLYIWTNTLISILQQKYINNKLDKLDARA